MNKNSLAISAAGIALLLSSAAPALAHEQGGSDEASVDVSATATVTADADQDTKAREHDSINFPFLKLRSAASTTVRANVQAKLDERAQERDDKRASTTQARIEKAQEHGENAIDVRIESLENLSDRLEKLNKLPADVLTSIQATLQAQIDQLVALKAKLGADVSTTTLKTDLKNIVTGNRVFLLVEPKARIASAASRIDAVVAQLQALATKLQDRITAAQTAGTDVSAAVTAMADMNAKLADAKTLAGAAVTLTANLEADNGDAAKLAANKAALKEARTKLANAEKDLAAARHDAATIYGVVKGKGGVKGEGAIHATTTP